MFIHKLLTCLLSMMRYSQLRSSTSCGRSKKRRRTEYIQVCGPLSGSFSGRGWPSLAAVASPSQRLSHCPRQPPASVSGALTVQLRPQSNQSNPIRSNPAKSLTSKPRPTTGFSLATSCLWLFIFNPFCKAKTAKSPLGAWPGLIMMISRASLGHSSQSRSA